MPIVVVNEGAPFLLNATLGVEDATLWLNYLDLYTNNYTPVPASVLGNFTQPSFSGYSAFPLVNSDWASPTIISDRASSEYQAGTPITWTNGGPSPVTIYGYTVYNNDHNALLYAEKFATPRTLNPGDTLELILVFTGGTEL
jgi:hypothetical protein